MKLTFEPDPQEQPNNGQPSFSSLPDSPQPTPPAPKKHKSLLLRLFGWFFGLIISVLVLGAAAVFLLFNWVSRDLPDLDRIIDFKAAQATTILARDGSLLGTLYHEKRFPITLSDMPKYLPMSFLAIEDSSFYEHPGINPLAIIRAVIVNFERGTKSQGGSTITQQIVKQLLLSSERSYIRKMKEAILATRLERELSKDQILALYLNYIYLGQHTYGVEAAARTYFGKHAANITLAEAALIAGMPQAPSRYNPFRHPQVAKQRQMEVLGRLKTLAWITPEEYTKAASEPLVYWSVPENVSGPAEWYFEEARRLLIEFFTDHNLKALGINTSRVGEDFVYEAGLTVQTAMDPLQQQLAGEALRTGLAQVDKRQGWRGPVKHLSSQAECQAFLDKKNFDSTELLGGQWTQALVTKASSREVRVSLGNGYIGVIPSQNMEWARHISDLATGQNARRILSEGDVIWVNAPDPAPRREQNKKEASDKKEPGKNKKQDKPTQPAVHDSAEYAPGKLITLNLQQEPLVQGALVSIEPQSGDIVALIGGYQFGNSHFNRATQSRRQPGSSFKPVVYSTALDNGFTPSSTVLDAPIEYVNPSTGQVWRPSNFEHNYRGELPLHTALTLSRNTPTVRLTQAVGVDKVIERAKQLGLEPSFPRTLAISLGAVAVSPLNLTQAYAAFANGGLGVRPRIITSIKDAKGRVLYKQDEEHWQAISPQNAYQMVTMLKEVVNKGTGARARIDGLNIAGKTGTSNDVHDVWFVGFSPYLCTGVYVGYDQLHSLGRQEQGGRTAAPIFKNYRIKADVAYKDSPQDFTAPEGITMVDGLAYLTSNTSPGLSATESGVKENIPDSAMPADTSEGSEELLRQMF